MRRHCAHVPLSLLLGGTLLFASGCTTVMPTATPGTGQAFSVAGRYVPPPPCDVDCWVTGGGWIQCGDFKITFGFNGNPSGKQDPLKGAVQVNVHDGSGGKFHEVETTSVTCRFFPEGNDTEVTITGFLRTGAPFTLVIRDNGEPGNLNSGKGSDTFNFTSNGTNYAGILGGGNVQVHPVQLNRPLGFS